MQDLAPARLVEYSGHSGYANEVGPHNPALKKRYLLNPVAMWAGQYVQGDDRHPMPAMHLDICDEMLSGNRVAMTAPRSFAKTTLCRNFILFHICEHKNIVKGKYKKNRFDIYPFKAIRYLSYSGTKAEEVLTQIKEILENNEEIRAQYGKFDPTIEDCEYTMEGQTWTTKRLRLSNGVEVSAAGRGAQVRGFRPDLLILDDLDEDEEIQSDERMEKAFRWFDSAVYNTIDEDEYKVFVIGTLLEEVSLLNYIGDKPSFKELCIRAYQDNIRQEGWEVWPSKWPHEKLQARLADIGYRPFMSEFMGMPQPSENPIFEREWFKPYDPTGPEFLDLLQRSMFTVEIIDPAISKRDGSDYTALVTMSATFEAVPRIFLRSGGVNRGHWTPNMTVDYGIKTFDAFFCTELIIETTAYQEALKYLFDDQAEMNRRTFNIREVKPDVDKERRANAVSPMVQRGQVYYDPNDPMHLKLIDECVLFKPGKVNIKKDLMDACVHGLTRFRDWAKTNKKSSTSRQVLPGGRRPSAVTGI